MPRQFKISTIIPISKLKNTIRAEEIRHINVLLAIERILKIAVYNQIEEYFSNNKLILKEQFGFRHKHRCETALRLLIAN